MGMGGGGGTGHAMSEINVTPLIDVLLVLIIIFMVVVIEQRPTGLTAEVLQPAPPTAKNIPPPDRTIVIHVYHGKPEGNNPEHPQVTVNEESVEWDRLRERLRDIFAIRVERIAFIEADDDIDFQDVADVIAITRVAGVDRVGLLTEDGKHAPVTGSSCGDRLRPVRSCGDEPLPRQARSPASIQSLISCPVLDPDRRPHESKRMPYLIFKKALVGKMQFHRPISKEYECRRRHRRLRHVVNSHTLAHWHGGAVKINRPQEPVHLSGGHTLAPLGGDLLDQRQNFFGPLARVRRDEDDGGIAQEFEPIPQPLLIELPVLRTLRILNARCLRLADGTLLAARDQVPFVHDDDHRAPALMRVSGDGGVKPADAFGSVHHKQRNVGSLQMPP